MNIDNYLQNKLEEYGEENANRMIELYGQVPNLRLKKIFSKIHFEVNGLLKYLNERLPQYDYGADSEFIGHYTANESRLLINWIDQIDEIQSNLKGTELQFEVHPTYKKVLEHCNTFLLKSGGSPIPKGTEKVILILIEPIFTIGNPIKIVRKDVTSTFALKFIGEGSYAKVFKYKDEFYNRHFVIKRAKDNLTPKEYERFLREFEEMKKLNSPYIVDVLSFDDKHRQYVMEFMDDTLYDHVMANNCKLTSANRKALVNQILKAFEYIHNKGLLHRDISLKNVLLKKYEDVIVVKVSDFGLVKLEESNLTSKLTEFKGSLNDPDLEIFGFNNYRMKHETYALTRLIYFVITGRTKIEQFETDQLKKFVLKGLDKNLDNRYNDVQELRLAFQNIPL